MIIQALVKYYESLLKQPKTVARGWCRAKAAFALHPRMEVLGGLFL